MPSTSQHLPPVGWPYAPREVKTNLVTHSDQTVPGMGGGWTLRLAPGVTLEGAAKPLAGAFGRGGVFRMGDAVIRPYRRGGMVRHVNRSTYVGIHRFESEFEVHARLFALGFPTVQPLGYGFRRRGLGWQGLFITRWIEANPWPSSWCHGPEFMAALGAAVKALEAAECWAPDLNATNVLTNPEGGVLLLDWDRASFGQGPGLTPRYRARLLRSLQKMQAPADVILELTKCLTDP